MTKRPKSQRRHDQDTATEYPKTEVRRRGEPKESTAAQQNASGEVAAARKSLVATDPEYAHRIDEFNALYVNETKKPERIRVVAIRLGYYGDQRRRVGKPFIVTLAPGERMPSWVLRQSDYDKLMQEQADAEIDGTAPPSDEEI